MEHLNANLYALHRGWLAPSEARELKRELAADANLRESSKQVERLASQMRALPALEVERSFTRELHSKIQRERINGEGPELGALIDLARGELSPTEAQRWRERMAQHSFLANLYEEIVSMREKLSQLSISPDSPSRERIAQALREERGDLDADSALLVDYLHGELSADDAASLQRRLQREPQLAQRERELSALLKLARSPRMVVDDAPSALDTATIERERIALSPTLPELPVEEDLRERIASAIAFEVASAKDRKARAPSDRSLAASALLAKAPKGRALKLPRHRIEREVLRSGRVSIVRNLLKPSTALAAAMHIFVLLAAFFVVFSNESEESGPVLRVEESFSTQLPYPDKRDVIEGDTGSGDPFKHDPSDETHSGNKGISFEFEKLILGEQDSSGGGLDTPRIAPANTLRPEVIELASDEGEHLRGDMQRNLKRASQPGVLFQLRRAEVEEKATYLPLPNPMPLYDKITQMQSWLAATQLADGSWRAAGKTWLDESYRMQETALVALALLGDGWLPSDDLQNAHGAGTLSSALAFLLTRQQSTGGFVALNGVAQDTVQVDAICTLALAEAFAGTQDYRYKLAMNRAIKRLVSKQITRDRASDPADVGGFPYVSVDLQEAPQADLVSGAWVMLALHTALANGLPRNRVEQTLADFAKHMRATVGIGSGTASEFAGIVGRSADSPQSQERGTASAMSAYRMASLLDPKPAELAAIVGSQLKFLNGDKYIPSHARVSVIGPPAYRTNFTAWFFNTTAVYHLDRGVQQGDERKWIDALFATYGEQGATHFASPESGQLYVLALGQEEEAAGSVFATAMACLCLENAYRGIPAGQ